MGCFRPTFTISIRRENWSKAGSSSSGSAIMKPNSRGNVVLDVWELLDFDAKRILNYSYEIYRGGEKIAWYDPFEHPHVSELAATHPHHKHVPPDIKHNRIPAPGISFEHPNLPFLIEE